MTLRWSRPGRKVCHKVGQPAQGGDAMLNDDALEAQTDEVEVAIIGCGPVGAMLANLLGLQGVRTLVLEREAAIYHLPRAVHFDDEVMRLLQTVGLAEAAAAHSRLAGDEVRQRHRAL